MINDSKSPFQIDFGTKPTTFELESIQAEINPDIMMADYAKGYYSELMRRNPVRLEASDLSDAVLFEYFKGLTAIRVESLKGECKVWRQAKLLLIPSFIQFALTQIGEVTDRERGLRIMPTYACEYNIDELLSTSMKLSAFTADGLVLHKDAMPRGSEGDIDVMSMAIINEYIVSQRVVSDPLASYIAGFMGMKLQEEATLKMLYRVRYDDLAFVKSALMSETKVFV